MRHYEWVFGPNYGMVDISLKDEGRPDVTSELLQYSSVGSSLLWRLATASATSFPREIRISRCPCTVHVMQTWCEVISCASVQRVSLANGLYPPADFAVVLVMRGMKTRISRHFAFAKKLQVDSILERSVWTSRPPCARAHVLMRFFFRVPDPCRFLSRRECTRP